MNSEIRDSGQAEKESRITQIIKRADKDAVEYLKQHIALQKKIGVGAILDNGLMPGESPSERYFDNSAVKFGGFNQAESNLYNERFSKKLREGDFLTEM